MSLIESNDLMVVQKVDNSTEKPILTFTLKDLDESLQSLYGYVKKPGDTMSGQLEISVVPDGLTGNLPLVITNGASAETVFAVDLESSGIVFADNKDQIIKKLGAGNLIVEVDSKSYVTFDDDNNQINVTQDVDLNSGLGDAGYMIHGLRNPDELTYPDSARSNYQASNIGYVKGRVLLETVQRNVEDQLLQQQIDLLKNYLDLFAKFSLQGNYRYNSSTKPPNIKYFWTNSSSFATITEIVVSTTTDNGTINSLNISEVDIDDFIGINPVDLVNLDLVDRTIFGVYKVNAAPTEDTSNNTYTFPVTYITGSPSSEIIVEGEDGAPSNGYKVRAIKSPDSNGITQFEGEQMFLNRDKEDTAEEHIIFNKGITINGSGESEINCDSIKVTNLQFDTSHLDVNPFKVKGQSDKETFVILNNSDTAKLSINGSGDIKYYSSLDQWYSTGNKIGSFQISRGTNANSDIVININSDPDDPTDLSKNIIEFKGNTVRDVAPPSSPEDVTDKNYVDNLFLDSAKRSEDNTFTEENVFTTPDGSVDDINFRLKSTVANAPPAIVFDTDQNNLVAGKIYINTSSYNDDVIVFGRSDSTNNTYVKMSADTFVVRNDADASDLFMIDRSSSAENSVSYTGSITGPDHITNKKYVLDRISKGITVKSTTTGAAGTQATVTASINSSADGVELDFVIPKGDKGSTSVATGNFVKNGTANTTITITKDSNTGVYTISGG